MLIERSIAALGATVARRWKERGNSAGTFCAIACEELAGSALLHAHGFDEIATWTMTAPRLPPQRMRPFGQPPIDLYRGDGFFIECLVWHDGITGIHDHAFSGAFGILRGSSIHARYRFRRASMLAESSWSGTAELDAVELLGAGAVRAIERGEALTHGLFHLERPTISLVLRTDTDPGTRQLQILYPSLLVPSRIDEPDFTRVSLMQSLAATDRDLFRALLPQAMASLSPGAAALVGAAACLADDGTALREALRPSAAEAGAAAIAAASLCAARTDSILEARRTLGASDEDITFLLAVLAAVPSRGGILDAVAQRFACDPIPKIAQLVERYVALVTGSSAAGSLADLARAALSGEAARGDEHTLQLWSWLVRTRLLEPLLVPRAAAAGSARG